MLKVLAVFTLLLATVFGPLVAAVANSDDDAGYHSYASRCAMSGPACGVAQ